MLPEIHLLGLTLKTFGVIVALAFVAAGVLIARQLKERGQPVDWAYELVLVAVIGGVIGAKAWYLVQNFGRVRGDILGALFSGQGLVWYGGLLGGALAVALWARRRRMLGLALLDVAAPALAAGYAVGRLACQVSGDGDYGKPSDLPWAMSYPDGVVPTTVAVHPTPVYEAIAMGVVAVVLWRLRGRLAPGRLFALYLALAGTERFLVEFLRRNDAVLIGLTAAQLFSAALLAIGLAWLASTNKTASPRADEPAARRIAEARP